LTALAARPSPRGLVLVTHHVEEIPPGFGHALVLGAGLAVAAGPIASTLASPALSRAFGLPIAVEHRNGRFRASLQDDA
jgi:iron complex transport system ATP-binding protein